MKKWYRVGICLLLTVCLLLLSACTGGQTPQTDDPQQSTGQSENNNDLPQNEKNNTAGHEQETPQQANGGVGDLAWNTSAVRTTIYSDVWETLYSLSESKGSYTENGDKENIHRLNYETWKDWSDYQMESHANCIAEGHCVQIMKQWQDDDPCAVVAHFQNAKYTEDYFKKNTLLVLDIINSGVDTPFAVKEVHYADNTLTCTVERQIMFWEYLTDHWCIFVEIGSVLPADTELKLEIKEYNDPRLDALPKTLDFNWKGDYEIATLFFNDAIGAKYKDSIYGRIYPYNSSKFNGSASMQLSYDSYTQLKADAEQLNLNAFESKSYTEEFFESNSLVLVNLTVSATRFEGLKDVRYENGVLTCYIQYDVPDDEEMVINETTYDYLFFIEIDTVLPEGVEIRQEIIPT